MLVSVRAKEPSTDASAQPHDEVAAQQAYLAVAHHLAQLDRPACGLWPVPTDMGLEGPARQLAAALAALGVKVGLVAPRALWRTDVSPSELPLSISPADDGFDVLTPGWPRGLDPGTVIEQALALVRDRYARSCSICRAWTSLAWTSRPSSPDWTWCCSWLRVGPMNSRWLGCDAGCRRNAYRA